MESESNLVDSNSEFIKKFYEDKEKKRIYDSKKREMRKLREEEEAKLRKEEAIKSMKYLLSKSVKFSAFFQQKLKNYDIGKKKKEILREIDMKNLIDDNESVTDKRNNTNNKKRIDVTKQIKYFEGGSLRDYQIEGLTWMIVLFENGVNGILADEMGLGKTIQVIALICYLIQSNVDGPYLIVAPLSTIPNWVSEFERFAPKIPVVMFHGSSDERYDIMWKIKNRKFYVDGQPVKPVIITTYNVPLIETKFLHTFTWKYIIVDEGHRIKNHESRLSVELRSLKSINRLLLTGTPLQNNLTELWALLNFLLPHIFTDIETFASLLLLEDMDSDKIVQEEKNNNIVSTIHKVLAPFMLRRLKTDVIHDLVPKKEVLVYCPMTKLQRDLYTFIIQRDLNKLSQKDEKEEKFNEQKKKRKCTYKRNYREKTEEDVENLFFEDFIKAEQKSTEVDISKENVQFIYRITMQNSMNMFKKAVDHPYLIHFPLNPKSKEKELMIDEQLVEQSGKMLVLDAMLAKLKKRKHKVLIFSTFVMMLDLIEDYVIMRNYKYCRLDGSQSLTERQENIAKFNKDPEIFVFLISTRAGGLGLNLTAADTVILYDRDWNPQVDIQAQDRCHRIGQKKPVVVYSLVTKNTIDERIIHFGNLKRRLEKIVIKDGKFKSFKEQDKTKPEVDLKELEELLKSSDCSHKIHSNGYVFSDKELDELLDRSDLYKQLEEMKKQNGI